MADALDPEEQPEEDPTEPMPSDPPADADRALILAAFLLLLRDTHTSLSGKVVAYLQQSLSLYELANALTADLLGAHTHAAYLGRRLAGNVAPLGLQDQQFAQSVLAEQAPYLTGLISDLHIGRYPLGEDGELPADLLARLLLYARRLRGTSNEAWARTMPTDTVYDWVEGDTHPCAVCPERAKGGPYTAETLPGFPGDGSTPCKSNCGCGLRVNGTPLTGFTL